MEINLLNEVQAQIDKCYEKYGEYHSQHEFLGVLVEEIFELKQCIYQKKLNKENLKAELIDVMTVLMKGYEDVIINNNIL